MRDIASVAAAAGGVEVEAFVHGALCVSYSGQCFSSEAWGGRSANRGQCAQACRLEYGLVVDGELRHLGGGQYLLSPQDLAAVEMVPEMVRAGVVSFKIEGKLPTRLGFFVGPRSGSGPAWRLPSRLACSPWSAPKPPRPCCASVQAGSRAQSTWR